MIICVSTVKQGAMPQFTIQVYNALKNNGIPARLILPKSDDIKIDFVDTDDIVFFDYQSSIIEKCKLSKQLSDVINHNEDEVWLCDETSLSMFIGLRCKVKYKIFVHDPNPHIYSFKIRRALRNFLINNTKKRVYKHAEKIVLMSKSSKEAFEKENVNYLDKLQLLRLGAPIQVCYSRKPSELNDEGYFMFFGSIEKYKNVFGLLSAFEAYVGEKKLVIAGKGILTNNELELIKKLGNKVTLINRFIQDEEMIHLFEHSSVVVLPYIEATQSGVLSMAYHFSKPVIVSDLPGLTEFVENGITGFVFKSQEDLTEKLTYFNTRDEEMERSAKNYEKEYLDFNKNINRLLKNQENIDVNET